MNRIDQIAPDRTAQTAGRHFNYVVLRMLDKQMIQSNVAELVDHGGSVAEQWRLQERVQKRCLTRAKEAGDHRNRNQSHHEIPSTVAYPLPEAV